MIYENEELRLRTININAEVEKGQSDIKRLRRENEQLRREIWTLRDECDRLNKRFKAKLAEYEKSDCSARESGGSSVSFLCDGLRYGDGHCGCNSEQYECETCRAIEDQCQNCAYENSNQSLEKRKMSTSSNFPNNTAKVADKYDHLSIVSEETHSNLETSMQKHEGKQLCNSSIKKEQPPPRSPIEKFADELIDAQVNIPPLSYFENVVERASHIATTPELDLNSTHAWDHNIQSPFAIRRQRFESINAAKIEPPIGWNIKNHIANNTNTSAQVNGTAQAIEVVELKEKVEKNSDLTNGSNTHPCSTFLSTKNLQNGNGNLNGHQHAEPPDLCVTNGLATPYQAQQVKAADKSHNIFREFKTSTDSEDISAENLESLLNDIENISEDICALQLQHQQQQRKIDEHDNRMRSKSRNNLPQDYTASLSHQYQNNRKAFRSEMNLMLSFDGGNTTFIPMNTNQVNLENNEHHPLTSTLGRDYEQSPQPCMPDPMTLLPENYGYLAHHKLKLNSIHNSANRLPNTDTTPNDAFPIPNINNIPQLSETPQPYELANLVPNRSQLYANVQNNHNNKSNQIYNAQSFPMVNSDYIDSTSVDITPDSTKENSAKIDFLNTQKDTISTISPHTAASWSDIPTAVDRKYLKSFSYSTPNSPHTTRRHSVKQKTGGSQETEKNKDTIASTLKLSIQQSSVHNKQRKNSRRHSDCTHLNTINPVVKACNNNGHCHLHRHHHHLHRPSLIKNCNSYMRKDSHVETGTTASDRHSNSFPSRESSISFNGVARKLSISSNKGGKIPWCGCWGNGCL